MKDDALLPVGLCSENSNGLVSLWDMLRFYAHNFVAAFSTFGQVMMELRSGHTMPSEKSLLAMGGNLGMLQKHCEEMGLEFSAMHLKRISESDDLRQLSYILKSLEEVQQRVWDELNARVYVQISPDGAKYYEPAFPPFGQLVFDQFPTAIDDVVEASNCLALERNTAAVFHLMRVMEAALRVLTNELGIPYAPSWESYLRQLNSLIEGDWKAKSPELRSKQTFYKEITGDLQTIKTAWRNPTMHIVKSYNHDEAVRIYDCVKHLMERFAEAGLSE